MTPPAGRGRPRASAGGVVVSPVDSCYTIPNCPACIFDESSMKSARTSSLLLIVPSKRLTDSRLAVPPVAPHIRIRCHGVEAHALGLVRQSSQCTIRLRTNIPFFIVRRFRMSGRASRQSMTPSMKAAYPRIGVLFERSRSSSTGFATFGSARCE